MLHTSPQCGLEGLRGLPNKQGTPISPKRLGSPSRAPGDPPRKTNRGGDYYWGMVDEAAPKVRVTKGPKYPKYRVYGSRRLAIVIMIFGRCLVFEYLDPWGFRINPEDPSAQTNVEALGAEMLCLGRFVVSYALIFGYNPFHQVQVPDI